MLTTRVIRLMPSIYTILSFGLFATVRAHSFHSYPYLYFNENQTNVSFPVVDHVAPTGDRQRESDYPDFLYKPNPGVYRVVEFYVHWCDICRHFSTHYVKHARKMQQLLADRKLAIPITFHGISCVPNKPICRKQEIAGHPLLKLFKPGDLKGVTMAHTEARPVAMLAALDINVTGMKDDKAGLDVTDVDSNGVDSWWGAWYTYIQGVDSSSGPGYKGSFRRTREDLKNDIHLSFDFAMRNNVYIMEGDDKLSDEAKDVLKEYFVLLQRTLPSSWVDMQSLLEELVRNIRYVTKKEPYLIKFLDKYPPKSVAEGGEPEWSRSCSKGEPGRGFTCGLWETFHAITVGLVGYNTNQVDDGSLLSTDSVASTIRNFVQYFFTCEECRQHFLKMYDTCAFQRCDRLKKVTKLTGDHVAELEWQQLSLWLYKVHNSVNTRLVREKAVRENREAHAQEMIDSTWPPLQECHPCWLPMDKTGTRAWNSTVVFNFLQLEYGQRDDSVADFQRQLLEANLAAVDDSVRMLRSGSSTIVSSSVFHPLLLLSVVVLFILTGAKGNACLRRVVLRKKVRTV